MCIIVYHPKGAELPAREVLERCERMNDDGAGLMVMRDRGLRLWKGFMNWRDFWCAYKTERLVERDEFALHFRLATSGGVEKGKCHPFPIVESRRVLHQLKFKPREGLEEAVMHNGILGKGKDGLSDTMVFVRTELASAVDFLDDDEVLKVIAKEISTDKLLIFWRGKSIKLGTWFEDKKTGLYYSNTGYKKVTYHQRTNVPVVWGKDWNNKNTFKCSGKKFTCPQCKMRDSHFSDWESGWDLITCFICGCRFNSKGDITGYNDFLWESYVEQWQKGNEDCTEEENKVIEADIVCLICKASTSNNLVAWDETVDRHYCFTCENYI